MSLTLVLAVELSMILALFIFPIFLPFPSENKIKNQKKTNKKNEKGKSKKIRKGKRKNIREELERS